MPLYVPVDKETRERLRQVAHRNRRRPQDEAALILENALLKKSASEPERHIESSDSEEMPRVQPA